jgi:predicted TIM-barrel fold metal-dependent hydrolase
LGVVGAIHIEASNWVEDNLWALQTARANEIMVGVVGNLDPEQPEFDSFLDRFHRDPMFRGIRYGNIWRYDVVRGSRNKDVLARLRRLPELNLVMDTATPGIELLDALFRLNDAIPDLRIVVDHLPSYEPDKTEQARYEGWLREVSGRRCIHVKLSEIVHRRGTIVSTRVEDYRASLDRIVDAFGEDRILFGSDYPTSDMVTTPDRVFRVAREYLSHRSQQFQEKVLFRNAWRVYGCQARTEQQRTMMAS